MECNNRKCHESSPAVANGVVYIGSEDHKLYAYNARTGALLWSATTGGTIVSSPAVANGIVYVGSSDGKLYAYAARTGTSCGARPRGVVESSPAVANGVVYVGSDDGDLYAYNPASGALLWNTTTGSNVFFSRGGERGGLCRFGRQQGLCLRAQRRPQRRL